MNLHRILKFLPQALWRDLPLNSTITNRNIIPDSSGHWIRFELNYMVLFKFLCISYPYPKDVQK